MEWISTSERLPGERGHVIVYYVNADGVGAVFQASFYELDGVFTDENYYGEIKPTHWQPLPEPPR